MANGNVRRPNNGVRRKNSTTGRRLSPEEQRILRLGRARKLTKAIFCLLVLGLVSVGLIYAGYLGWQQIVNSPSLRLKKISIVGNRYISNDEIKATAEIKIDDRILDIEHQEITKKLLAHNWIKEVNLVKRQLPDRLSIEVTEYLPQAVIAFEELYLLDEEGFPFALAPLKLVPNFLLITGLEHQYFEENPEKAKNMVKLGYLVVNTINKDEEFADCDIVELHVSHVSGIDVELGKKKKSETKAFCSRQKSNILRLSLGFAADENGYAEKLELAKRASNVLIKENKIARIIYLDNNKQPRRVFAKLVNK